LCAQNARRAEVQRLLLDGTRYRWNRRSDRCCWPPATSARCLPRTWKNTAALNAFACWDTALTGTLLHALPLHLLPPRRHLLPHRLRRCRRLHRLHLPAPAASAAPRRRRTIPRCLPLLHFRAALLPHAACAALPPPAAITAALRVCQRHSWFAARAYGSRLWLLQRTASSAGSYFSRAPGFLLL